MIDTRRKACLEDLADPDGRVRGIGRAGEDVGRHGQAVPGPGSLEHELDEVRAALGHRPGHPEKAREAHHVMDRDLTGEELPRKLGHAVGIERVGGVLLRVGDAFPPVEDVVRTDVDEGKIQGEANVPEVLDPDGVDGKGPLGILLALRNIVVGRRIDDDGGAARLQGPAEPDGFTNVHVFDVQRGTAWTEDLHELPSELPPGSDDRNLHVGGSVINPIAFPYILTHKKRKGERRSRPKNADGIHSS